MSNGAVFEGEFINGAKNGFGEYYWQDKSSYKGSWKKDLFEGNGEY